VPVGGRHLTRHDQLHPAIERRGALGRALEAGILQDQHTALCFLGGDQVRRLHQPRAHGVVLPHHRLAAALRLRRDDGAHDRPQRAHALRLDGIVERFAGFGVDRGGMAHGSVSGFHCSPNRPRNRRGFKPSKAWNQSAEGPARQHACHDPALQVACGARRCRIRLGKCGHHLAQHAKRYAIARRIKHHRLFGRQHPPL
jgi:hypothetical protein